jgi:hypothetical protein
MGDLTPDCGVFFARQRSFQTAAVNRDTKLFSNRLDTGDSRQAGLGSSQGPHIVDDFGGQLVPLFGSTVLGKQPAQAGLLECSLGLIDGGARNAKLGSHIDDRDSLHAVSAQHLVANLEEILGVEKWILSEQSVGNRIGVASRNGLVRLVTASQA